MAHVVYQEPGELRGDGVDAVECLVQVATQVEVVVEVFGFRGIALGLVLDVGHLGVLAVEEVVGVVLQYLHSGLRLCDGDDLLLAVDTHGVSVGESVAWERVVDAIFVSVVRVIIAVDPHHVCI